MPHRGRACCKTLLRNFGGNAFGVSTDTGTLSSFSASILKAASVSRLVNSAGSASKSRSLSSVSVPFQDRSGDAGARQAVAAYKLPQLGAICREGVGWFHHDFVACAGSKTIRCSRLGKTQNPPDHLNRKALVNLGRDFLCRASGLGVVNDPLHHHAGPLTHPTLEHLPGSRSTSGQWLQSIMAAVMFLNAAILPAQRLAPHPDPLPASGARESPLVTTGAKPYASTRFATNVPFG